MKLTDKQREEAMERDSRTIAWEVFEDVRIGYEKYARAEIESCIFWPGLIADLGIKMTIFKRDFLDGIFPNGFESGVGIPFPKQHKGPEIFAFLVSSPDRRYLILEVEIKDTGIRFDQSFTLNGYGRNLSEISPTVRHIFQIESYTARESVKQLIEHVFTQLSIYIIKQSIYDKFFEHVKAEQAKG